MEVQWQRSQNGKSVDDLERTVKSVSRSPQQSISIARIPSINQVWPQHQSCVTSAQIACDLSSSATCPRYSSCVRCARWLAIRSIFCLSSVSSTLENLLVLILSIFGWWQIMMGFVLACCVLWNLFLAAAALCACALNTLCCIR